MDAVSKGKAGQSKALVTKFNYFMVKTALYEDVDPNGEKSEK